MDCVVNLPFYSLLLISNTAYICVWMVEKCTSKLFFIHIDFEMGKVLVLKKNGDRRSNDRYRHNKISYYIDTMMSKCQFYKQHSIIRQWNVPLHMNTSMTLCTWTDPVLISIHTSMLPCSIWNLELQLMHTGSLLLYL